MKHFTWQGSCADLWNALAHMSSLHNINFDGAYDGQQRNAASVMLDILAGTKQKTATRGCGRGHLRSTKNQWTKSAVRSACNNTVGRAIVIVREDATKNGAWASAKLQERIGRDSEATSFTEVFKVSWPNEKPFERVKKVSKLPQWSPSSQAIEQLTISGLSRHGQPEFENHLRLKTDGMARHSVSGRKYLHNLSPTTPWICVLW